jgi:hypothetical protein
MTVDTYNSAVSIDKNIGEIDTFLTTLGETPETVSIEDVASITVALEGLSESNDTTIIAIINAANVAYFNKLRTDLTTKKAELQTQFDNL